MRGDDTDRRGEGGNEVVVSEGDRLVERKRKGGGDGIRTIIRIGDRHGRGGGTELIQWGERLEWVRMEWSECRPVGIKFKLVIYHIMTESSDWIAAVLGLEKPPNNEQDIWSR